MYLTWFEDLCRPGETIERAFHHHQDLVLDPRANYPNYVTFDLTYHDDGNTVSLLRTDTRVEDDARLRERRFSMRVHDRRRTESLPDFESTTYEYSGIENEYAPADTVEGIISRNTMIIRQRAFKDCNMMRRCTLHDTVDTIESCAFYNCAALVALILPSSISNIEGFALHGCRNIRIFPLPDISIVTSSVGAIRNTVISDCDTFFKLLQIDARYNPRLQQRNIQEITNNREVYQGIIGSYNNLHAIFGICLSTAVSRDTIHECIRTHGIPDRNARHGGMTWLHILVLNPHADKWAMLEGFKADMQAQFIHDTETGLSAIDDVAKYNLDAHTLLNTQLNMNKAGMTLL